ncbi:hypothetical protein H4R34_005935 [Dimargaris verticillata]|uniref:Condensation domain-containing protein n=1 Tax=Dimargaris verticillata TaxID=2761393 RepID=A0A9W8AX69_9FUNG|nr:hypothetical protein H4R34_005935 [Dimargaris verticillata]
MAQDLDVSTIALPMSSSPLPLDYPHVPLNRSKEYEATEILTIDGELLRRFNAYTQQHTVTAVDLLMTALLLACNQRFNMPSITVAFESNGRSPPGQSCDVSRTLGWFVSHYYLTLTTQPNDSPKATLERTQSTLHDLPVNGFNLFLAKHLKSFSKPCERAQFNINPELAFGYSDDQALNAANNSLPIAPQHDLLSPVMAQLLPNAHPYPLVVSCQHGTDKLEIYLVFHINQFHSSTAKSFAATVSQALDALVL